MIKFRRIYNNTGFPVHFKPLDLHMQDLNNCANCSIKDYQLLALRDLIWIYSSEKVIFELSEFKFKELINIDENTLTISI